MTGILTVILVSQYLLRFKAKFLQGQVEHGRLWHKCPRETGTQHQVKVALQDGQDLSSALALRGIIHPQVSQHTGGNPYERGHRKSMNNQQKCK